MNTTETIYHNVLEGDASTVEAGVRAALDEGLAPETILKQGLISAMDEVGKLYEAGEYFVPEMLVAARAMQAGLRILKQKLVAEGSQSGGRIAVGTVKGDLHDIGKNLVVMMLEGAGFEVKDLGVNVDPTDFVKAAQEGAQVLGMSALLTTTMNNMQITMEALKTAGVRGQVKVIIGGAPVTEDFARKIGAVATPCQALALAKMRSKPYPAKDSGIEKLRLVIGLFCGWALSWKELKALLEKRFGQDSILGMDIPPSKHNSMEIHTPAGIVEVPLAEVIPFVRKSCRYCWDMTAEFSDLSVGSARIPEGWQVARGWNQVIVRTPAGQDLLNRARARGLLEFRDMPDGNLERLKKASLNKKRAALQNLAQMSGNPEDLLYLDSQDPVFRALMGS